MTNKSVSEELVSRMSVCINRLCMKCCAMRLALSTCSAFLSLGYTCQQSTSHTLHGFPHGICSALLQKVVAE